MTIEICNICKGEGEYFQSELIEGGKLCKCTKCDGSGRLVVGTYKYTVPFTKDRSLLYEADSKIYAVIRALEKK